VPKVMSAYTNHWKGTSAKRNCGRKSALTKKYRRTLRWTVSKNHINSCSTGDRAAELNILLDDPVSTKTVRSELHKSNIHGRVATAKPLTAESNAQMRKRWCHDHKTWTPDNWKRMRDMASWVVLHAVP
jgi:hypothetical protein